MLAAMLAAGTSEVSQLGKSSHSDEHLLFFTTQLQSCYTICGSLPDVTSCMLWKVLVSDSCICFSCLFQEKHLTMKDLGVLVQTLYTPRYQYLSFSLLPNLIASASSSPSWQRALGIQTCGLPSTRSFSNFMARKGLRLWSRL